MLNSQTLNESLFSNTDRLTERETGSSVSNDDNRQTIVNFSPVINIPAASDNKEQNADLIDELLSCLKSEFTGMLSSNELDVRMDANLMDGN